MLSNFEINLGESERVVALIKFLVKKNIIPVLLLANLRIIRIMFTGENSIVIVLGANESLTPEHADSSADVIKSASVLLCQFEIPLETTLHALKLHQGHGLCFFFYYFFFINDYCV